GTYNGSLKTVPATELGATVIRDTLSRANLEGGRIDTIVMGNAIQAGNRQPASRGVRATELRSGRTRSRSRDYHSVQVHRGYGRNRNSAAQRTSCDNREAWAHELAANFWL